MSNSSEKFCLKWNDFQQNIISSFGDLRKDNDFSDVTLVCEEDQKIEAHRIILTACSPFFSSVLKKNKHSHPLIYMRGLKAKDLVAILDFIYYGEANICQDDLEGFLALAEELQLKGLAKSEDPAMYDTQENISTPLVRKSRKQTIPKEENTNGESQYLENTNFLVPMNVDKALLTIDPSIEDLKAKIDSLLERDMEGHYRCSVCGKTNKGIESKKIVKQHIETHFEGFAHPCNQCEKVTRSRHSLQMHIYRHHGK